MGGAEGKGSLEKTLRFFTYANENIMSCGRRLKVACFIKQQLIIGYEIIFFSLLLFLFYI